MTKLYLAIPCYNEEEVLRDSAEKLNNKYNEMMAEGKISPDSKIDRQTSDAVTGCLVHIEKHPSTFNYIEVRS